MRLRLPTTRQFAAVAALLAYLAGTAILVTLWLHGQPVNWAPTLSYGFLIAVLFPRAFKGPHA